MLSHIEVDPMTSTPSSPRNPSAGSAGVIDIFHADSLAGPMSALKTYFEAAHAGASVNLTAGTSKQLAESILKGGQCDVFASSSPAVIAQYLMNKTIPGSARNGASWYVVFSANEMVVIVAKGNAHGIRHVADLARPGIRFIRVMGDNDLATGRTIEFVRRACAFEGRPELAQMIVANSINVPAMLTRVPDVVRAVRDGMADAGIVYYSAAVAAASDVDIVRFDASVNMSEAIRNTACVPGSAKNENGGLDFVRFLLTPEAQNILQSTGQPPLVPAIYRGELPPEIRIWSGSAARASAA
jgi:molybdenum ABC transporter molybdate-binding protein